MEYDTKNMCNLFMNFVNSYARKDYVHISTKLTKQLC
jgi:hypothetical protein